jgi:hypothetical protein
VSSETRRFWEGVFRPVKQCFFKEQCVAQSVPVSMIGLYDRAHRETRVPRLTCGVRSRPAVACQKPFQLIGKRLTVSLTERRRTTRVHAALS